MPAVAVTAFAAWYGGAPALRLSAAIGVLTATLAVSLTRLPRAAPAAVAAAVSAGASVWSWRFAGRDFTDPGADPARMLLWSAVEIAALAALAVPLGRERARPARWCGWLLVAAAVMVGMRLLPRAGVAEQLFLGALGAAAVLAGYVLGWHLRAMDRERAVAVARARAEQRRALVADLHDYVAHDIAGIAVAAQSARIAGMAGRPGAAPGSPVASGPGPVAAGSGPAAAVSGPTGFGSGPVAGGEDPAVAAIEKIELAAVRALQRLDRGIRLLRIDGDTVPSPRGLADLPDLVGACPLPVDLRVTVSRPDEIPAPVQATAHRIVAEALTNVARHAHRTRRVDVRVHARGADSLLDVTIRNGIEAPAESAGPARLESPARSAGPARARPAGAGLADLRARVQALDGTLYAGTDNGAWLVRATLPLD